MLRALLDIIFPPVCLLCGESSLKKGFCEACLMLIEKERITTPICSTCGTPFPSPKGVDHECGRCLKERPHFKSARSAFVYDGRLLNAIHRFKYGGDTSLAVPLARSVLGALAPSNNCLVVPVPLHPKKLKARGFNQSLLIARELARLTGFPVSYDNLKRARDTGQQVGLKSLERNKNVAGAFILQDPVAFKDKKALLVDDVITTGATINECARLLKNAGAEVFALTVARTVKV